MQALSCVRRSREVRQLLATKTAMLENLQHILHQIQMAETNAMVRVTQCATAQHDCVFQVLDAYCKGTKALKAMQRSSGQSVANAEKIMEALYEVYYTCNTATSHVSLYYKQAVQVADTVGDVLGEDVMRDSMEEEELEGELQGLLSTMESSHEEPASLAEQLSKLQLITPPDTAPANANSSEKQQTESHSSSSTSHHHAPLT